jgi:hypothetical protein
VRLIRVRWELLKIQHTLMSVESQRENFILSSQYRNVLFLPK